MTLIVKTALFPLWADETQLTVYFSLKWNQHLGRIMLKTPKHANMLIIQIARPTEIWTGLKILFGQKELEHHIDCKVHNRNYLEQVAKAVVKGVIKPERKLKGFLRVSPK